MNRIFAYLIFLTVVFILINVALENFYHIEQAKGLIENYYFEIREVLK